METAMIYLPFDGETHQTSQKWRLPLPNNACSQGTAHFKNFVSSRNVREDTTNIFKTCVTTEPFPHFALYNIQL